MRALLAAGLVVALLGACSSQQDAYCDTVADRQAELGKVLGTETPDALLNALPIFRDLADEAPDDIRPDWRTLIDALEGLETALDDAGVDAGTYDRDDPPADVTEEQRAAIDAAAEELTSPQTVAAFEGVQQQAKDVCGTPLDA